MNTTNPPAATTTLTSLDREAAATHAQHRAADAYALVDTRHLDILVSAMAVVTDGLTLVEALTIYATQRAARSAAIPPLANLNC